ncbi:MAG: aminotransferase class I/II-fold pyridoxal phosphate-dependent enzyme, partial [Bradyrhizobium sp.]|nr:aminotransferase class I/II-fold pyridoxal phosphate-dependent enzyme [Bradyrhizobium sp.]
VIVDEAYLEFMPDFAARSVAPLVREGGNVAVFRSFSKIFGLASLAIGYTLAPKPLAAALKQMGIGHGWNLGRDLPPAQANGPPPRRPQLRSG